MSRRDQAGRISVFVAATLPTMLLFIGLMWDASGYLRALHRADNLASEAARAAGQAIDLSRAIGEGEVAVDPVAAQAAVAAYTADAEVTGEVQVATDGQELTVTIMDEWEPELLGAFGFGPKLVTGEATAHLIEQ